MQNNLKDYFNLKLESKKPPVSIEKYSDRIEEVNSYNLQGIQNPRISFLLVAHNENELLFKALNSITCAKSRSYEIVVVDNGLSEPAKERLRSYSLKHIVMNKNVGGGTGRNIGSLYCNAPVIFFVDADGYLEDVNIAFDKVQVLINDHKLVAIRGKVKQIRTGFIRVGSEHYDLGDKVIPCYINTEGISMFKRKDFIEVGGFEDGLMGHEGIFLCFRMVEFYGYDKDSFLYDPDLVLFHDYYDDLTHLSLKVERYKYLFHILTLKYPLIQSFRKYYKDIEYIKFTVVITSYNKGRWLKEAINSVLSQTLQDVQLIVVDDCSDEPETIKVLNQISNNVHIIRLDKNRGLSAARNEGIKNADSEYICCLDGDDYLEPTYLEKARNVFENYKNVGIVASFFNTFGDITGKSSNSIGDTSLVRMLTHDYILATSCFRREASVKVGMYDENLKSHEDWEHWINIAKDGWKIRVIHEYLVNIRRHEHSLYASNVNMADVRCSYIINKHRKLYEKHWVKVIAAKHLKLVSTIIQRRRWQAQHKDLETQHKDLETQHKDLETQHKDLETQHKDLETQHKDLETQHKDLETQHKDLETQHKDLETQHKDLETQHKDLETQHKGLQKLIYKLLFGY